MVADVAAEPAQHGRQLQERTAPDRSGNGAPVRVVGPVGILEAMLDAEQPNADDGRDRDDRELDSQHGPNAEGQDHRNQDGRDQRVRQVNRPPLAHPGARRLERQAVEHQEHDGRDDQVGDQRVPHGAGQPAPRWRHGFVFLDRQACRVDVARHVSPVQVVPTRVVLRVMTAPIGEWRQRRQAAQHADHNVGPARLEECPVPAIVLYDEQPHHQPGGRQHEREAEPE